MIKQLLDKIEEFLNDRDADALGFSIEVEDYLVEAYDKMMKEDAAVTYLMNENLPDICASYEVGMDISEFKTQIEAEYNLILQLLQKGVDDTYEFGQICKSPGNGL